MKEGREGEEHDGGKRRCGIRWRGERVRNTKEGRDDDEHERGERG